MLLFFALASYRERAKVHTWARILRNVAVVVSLWVFIDVMDVYGCSYCSLVSGRWWVSEGVMGNYEFLWISMGFWVSMGVYGCLWVVIDFWVFMGLQVFMGVYRCLWVPMGVYGFLGAYGYIWVSWVSMGIYGCHGRAWVP